MTVLFDLEGFSIGDGFMTTHDIFITVEATIEYEEVWGFGCNTVAYDPYVEDVVFIVTLDIESPAANTAYAAWLHKQYKADKDFKDQIDALARCAYYEREESEKVEAALARRSA